LAQFGAERGVQTGSIGSPNSNAALMSLFGTNSLALQNQGMHQFGQQIAQTPQGQQFNPFGFLVSPQEQQAAQYQANLLNSAPVPSSAQFANLNALQSGRGAGYSGFAGAPSPMMPSSAPVYQGGQQPVGGINPPNTGGTAYSSSYTAQPFQTGYQATESPGWNPQDFLNDSMFGNPFGGGEYPPMDPGVPYNPGQSPVGEPWNPPDPFNFNSDYFADAGG